MQLDPGLYPGESGRLVWDKALHDREQRDSIQLRRLGSRPCEATITLELDHQPVQYRLSSALAGALALRGLHSMPFVMQMLWGYIKAKQLYEVRARACVCVCVSGEQGRGGGAGWCMSTVGALRVGWEWVGGGVAASCAAPGCQPATAPPLPHPPCLPQPSDKGSVCVRCDERLRPLFGTDSVELGKMAEALKQHLTLPEPVKLQYTIKCVSTPNQGLCLRHATNILVHPLPACHLHLRAHRPDGSAAPHPDCYDFEVEVPLRCVDVGVGTGVDGMENGCTGDQQTDSVAQAMPRFLFPCCAGKAERFLPRVLGSCRTGPAVPTSHPLAAARSCRRMLSRRARGGRWRGWTWRSTAC